MGERPIYNVEVERLSEADGGGFVAIVPDLPGCMSDGETEFEAIQNAQDAIECWLEAARENRQPIPTPSPLRRVAG
jgi:predicted RNase H-like HicB family nuclease